MYIIGRPANGITVNGLEYVLDSDGDYMRFKDKEDALNFLSFAGIGKALINDMDIQIIDEEE